jgi:hypothetical protein
LILVLSLPFLLFSFVTTLLNHIEVQEVDPVAAPQPLATVSNGNVTQQTATA